MEGGYVFSWGTGYLGQLGLGDDSSWDTPRMIRHLDPKRLGDAVKNVVCGGSHSGVITNNGNIYMWGLNRNGQTGTGAKVESVLEPRPLDITDIGRKQPKSLVCGRNHSLLLTNEGRVYSWGAGGVGRLGLSDNTRKNVYSPCEIQFFRSRPAKLIISGDFHNIALGIDGHIYTWGFNLEGQCGNGTTVNQKLPTKINIPYDFINSNSPSSTSTSSSSSSSSNNSNNNNNLYSTNIQQITSGANWGNVITSTGVVFSWGYSDGGWLPFDTNYNYPYIESDVIPPPHIDYSKSFDSNLNVLKPVPIEYFLENKYRVKWIRCGGGHTIYCVVKDETINYQPNFSSNHQFSKINYNSIDHEKNSKSNNDNDFNNDDYKQQYLSEGKQSYDNDYDNNNNVDSKYSSKQTSSSSSTTINISGHFGTSSSSSFTSSTSSSVQHITVDSIETFNSWVRHKKIPEILSVLSRKLVNINESDENGNTPLHIACQNGHFNVCKILLENGGTESINAQNNGGNTPLHYSMTYGFNEMSQYLINQFHANDEIVNKEGLTCYEGLKKEDLERI